MGRAAILGCWALTLALALAGCEQIRSVLGQEEVATPAPSTDDETAGADPSYQSPLERVAVTFPPSIDGALYIESWDALVADYESLVPEESRRSIATALSADEGALRETMTELMGMGSGVATLLGAAIAADEFMMDPILSPSSPVAAAIDYSDAELVVYLTLSLADDATPQDLLDRLTSQTGEDRVELAEEERDSHTLLVGELGSYGPSIVVDFAAPDVRAVLGADEDTVIEALDSWAANSANTLEWDAGAIEEWGSATLWFNDEVLAAAELPETDGVALTAGETNGELVIRASAPWPGEAPDLAAWTPMNSDHDIWLEMNLPPEVQEMLPEQMTWGISSPPFIVGFDDSPFTGRAGVGLSFSFPHHFTVALGAWQDLMAEAFRDFAEHGAIVWEHSDPDAVRSLLIENCGQTSAIELNTPFDCGPLDSEFTLQEGLLWKGTPASITELDGGEADTLAHLVTSTIRLAERATGEQPPTLDFELGVSDGDILAAVRVRFDAAQWHELAAAAERANGLITRFDRLTTAPPEERAAILGDFAIAFDAPESCLLALRDSGDILEPSCITSACNAIEALGDDRYECRFLEDVTHGADPVEVMWCSELAAGWSAAAASEQGWSTPMGQDYDHSLLSALASAPPEDRLRMLSLSLVAGSPFDVAGSRRALSQRIHSMPALCRRVPADDSSTK